MDGASSGRALRRLLDGAGAVLFDFDGPICDLFGPRSTAYIAAEVKAMAREEWGPLDREVEACDDSHRILPRLRDMLDRHAPGSLSRRPLVRADAIVTRHEYTAAASAEPAPGVTELVGLLRTMKKRLVVVSNNAPGPVRTYLEREGLLSEFEAVCGRDPYEPRHMKPDPHSVLRALKHLDDPSPESVVLLGDQLTDLTAARAAKTRFLGYTQNEQRAQEMRRRRADWVVSSHQAVIDAVTAARPRIHAGAEPVHLSGSGRPPTP